MRIECWPFRSPRNAVICRAMDDHMKSGAGDEEVAEDEGVHLSAAEAVKSFFGAADGGFVVVEGSVEDDGNAGEIFEGFDKLPVTRIGFVSDGLQAASTVNVGGCGDVFTFFGAHGVSPGHKRRSVELVKSM